MNFKKSALALAMAGIVAAPMAAQAAAGDGAYVSLRIGLHSVEKNGGEGVAGGTESLNVNGYSSRWGFKTETDLGNGMTGFGRIEFGLNTETVTNSGRLAFVGVKGDFGSVTLGRQWATFYSHAVAPNDNPWSGSGYAMVRYGGRTANNLTYAGGAGAVSYGVSLQMNDVAKESNGNSETLDALELGLSFDAGFGKFGIGYRDAKADKSVAGTVDADPVIGLALSGIAAGPITLGFGYQKQDVVATPRTMTSFLVDAGIGNAYVHFESLDADNVGGAGDKDSLAIGYTKSLGPQTSAWFEYHDVDTAGGNTGDQTAVRAVLKYDL